MIVIEDLKRRLELDAASCARLRELGALLRPCFPDLLDVFYGYIERDPSLMAVIKRSGAKFANLKITLKQWLEELFSGEYDSAYAERRMRIGTRHVEIGLDHQYVLIALNLIREFLHRCIVEHSGKTAAARDQDLKLMHKIVDLDAILVGWAYTTGREAAAVQPIADSVECLIVEITPAGRIVYVNSYCETLFQIPPARLIDKPFSSLFPKGSDISTLETGVRQALDGESRRQGYEIEISGPGGQPRILRWTMTRQFGRDALVSGLIMVAQDITEDRFLQKHMAQQDKLISMGRLAAGLAHDIKSPLNSIRLRVDEALADADPELRDALDPVPATITRISKMIEQMLDLTRPRAGLRKRTDVHQLIEAAIDITWHDVRRENVRIDKTFWGEALTAEVDADAMLHAFLNLLLNAVDAVGTSGGGVTVSTTLKNNKIEIRFRDDGPGIPDEITSMIFHPYVTTKSSSGGTGLGLWITDSIIREHGGTIELVSAPKRGAEFKVTLPAVKQ